MRDAGRDLFGNVDGLLGTREFQTEHVQLRQFTDDVEADVGLRLVDLLLLGLDVVLEVLLGDHQDLRLEVGLIVPPDAAVRHTNGGLRRHDVETSPHNPVDRDASRRIRIADVFDADRYAQPLDRQDDGQDRLQLGESTRPVARERLGRELVERSDRDLDGVRLGWWRRDGQRRQRTSGQLGRHVHAPSPNFNGQTSAAPASIFSARSHPRIESKTVVSSVAS